MIQPTKQATLGPQWDGTLHHAYVGIMFRRIMSGFPGNHINTAAHSPACFQYTRRPLQLCLVLRPLDSRVVCVSLVIDAETSKPPAVRRCFRFYVCLVIDLETSKLSTIKHCLRFYVCLVIEPETSEPHATEHCPELRHIRFSITFTS